ncbi:cupin domain-containing protein [Nonomuraea rhizosphaerae]|uniref:cupin domain-containing protein n=1 Tax=Nonomuraea rhizosphaerae TaxID=2665663 RepID=UPI001C5E170F|nr:cupin domain-containing protein [Nonomuraea rhizosphaerae]
MAVAELLCDPAPFSSSLFTVPQGAITDPDQHEVVEMWFIHRGAGTLLSGGEELPVKAGDTVLLRSQVPHQVRNTGTELLEVLSIWWRRPR